MKLQRDNISSKFFVEHKLRIFRWVVKILPDEHFQQRYFQWSSSISVIISVVLLFQSYSMQVTGNATNVTGSCKRAGGSSSSIHASWDNYMIRMEFKFLKDGNWFLHKIEAEVYAHGKHKSNTVWILKFPIFLWVKKMELFVKTVNDFQFLTFFTRNSHLRPSKTVGAVLLKRIFQFNLFQYKTHCAIWYQCCNFKKREKHQWTDTRNPQIFIWFQTF